MCGQADDPTQHADSVVWCPSCGADASTPHWVGCPDKDIPMVPKPRNPEDQPAAE